MEHRSKVVALALTVYSVLNLMLSSGAAEAQEKIKFPVGVGTKTIGTNMFWLGTKKGFFDEFGLDVQPVLLRGTAITMQALVSESLLLALGSADATIGAAASGADLLAVGGVVNGLTQAIVAAKNYKSLKDLRGATIGVQVLTSGATNVLKRILKQNGLDYPADYKLLAVGGGNFNLAALSFGTDRRYLFRRAARLHRRAARLQRARIFQRLFPELSTIVVDRKASLGGKKSRAAGPFSQGGGARPSLALRQQGSGDRFSRQGNPAQAGARAAGVGILHRQSYLAPQRGNQS